MKLHIPGYPRVGANRELKVALEAYWAEQITAEQLEDAGRSIRRNNWQAQVDANLDLITVGDFAWYDHILTLSATLGVVPERHKQGQSIDLDTLFRMARGRAPSGQPTTALAMTKWFDTNYHYLVPELSQEQTFALSYGQILQEVAEAKRFNKPIKVVLTGPVTFLALARGGHSHRLDLLPALCAGYQQLLHALQQEGVSWVQLDEPLLATELSSEWRQAFEQAYHLLQRANLNLLVAVYFGYLNENLSLLANLPVQGVHIDAIRGAQEIDLVVDRLGPDKVLSLGFIDGRNVWAANLADKAQRLRPIAERLGDRLWLSSNCSLLHVPVDLDAETLAPSVAARLAFAKQKLQEIQRLGVLVNDGDSAEAHAILAADQQRQQLAAKGRTLDGVQLRLQSLGSDDYQRLAPFDQRILQQRQRLQLPLLPTTTIGSFPQTRDIRQVRSQWRQGTLSDQQYDHAMTQAIEDCVRQQDRTGLDVLVHGEFERNDMVEYFGEQIPGMVTSRFGWVQSYGSRCVKPPIIHGDLSWPGAMTVKWYQVAQQATNKWLKGMLTGPVTLLNWSFVRDDIGRDQVCAQLALVIRDEVAALEKAGAAIIQIDEAALREGLPLRDQDRQQYLRWAIDSFRLCSAGVANDTQIHTHMCYSHFNDIIEQIAAMDADVITIETSRNQMKLLDAFKDFNYPNDIGPGVWDIHSPNVPSLQQIKELLLLAQARIPLERLWINPDCGLKTRGWPEVAASLKVMVQAARELRAELAVPA